MYKNRLEPWELNRMSDGARAELTPGWTPDGAANQARKDRDSRHVAARMVRATAIATVFSEGVDVHLSHIPDTVRGYDPTSMIINRAFGALDATSYRGSVSEWGTGILTLQSLTTDQQNELANQLRQRGFARVEVTDETVNQVLHRHDDGDEELRT